MLATSHTQDRMLSTGSILGGEPCSDNENMICVIIETEIKTLLSKHSTPGCWLSEGFVLVFVLMS